MPILSMKIKKKKISTSISGKTSSINFIIFLAVPVQSSLFKFKIYFNLISVHFFFYFCFKLQ